MGRLPSWEPQVASEIAQAIREACPGVIFNQSTGVVGADISGPVACMRAIRPEVAACNAGSLNYLKATAAGTWAWPPMLFDNPVAKVEAFLAAMRDRRRSPSGTCETCGPRRRRDSGPRNPRHTAWPKPSGRMRRTMAE